MSTFILLLFLDVCQVFAVVIVFDDIDFNISINVNINVIMSTCNRKIVMSMPPIELTTGKFWREKKQIRGTNTYLSQYNISQNYFSNLFPFVVDVAFILLTSKSW